MSDYEQRRRREERAIRAESIIFAMLMTALMVAACILNLID